VSHSDVESSMRVRLFMRPHGRCACIVNERLMALARKPGETETYLLPQDRGRAILEALCSIPGG